MRYTSWVAALLAAVVVGLPAQATTTFPRERVCPVGGEKYQSFEIGSTSYYGIRLDGQRTGVGAHLPYVECPNGFVVYRDESEFSADDIAKLTPVVAGAEYQALRAGEPVAARVVMLERALGKSDAEIRGWLFRASFESEDNGREAVHRKYLEQAAAAYTAFLAGHPVHDDEWWFAGLRRADLLRQLGRFEECAAAVAELQKAHDKEDPFLSKVAAQILKRSIRQDAQPASYEEEKEESN